MASKKKKKAKPLTKTKKKLTPKSKRKSVPKSKPKSKPKRKPKRKSTKKASPKRTSTKKARRKPLKSKRKVSKKPKPKRKRKPRVKAGVGYLRLGGYADYSTATHLSTDAQKEHYKNFSHLTRTPPRAAVTGVFDNAVEGHLAKMGIEYDDLRIFSYGILLRPDGKEITPSLVSEISIILEGVRNNIVVAEEYDSGQNALMINFGKENRSVSVETVRNRLFSISDLMEQIYDLLSDELEVDVDWVVWWDTDEVMY